MKKEIRICVYCGKEYIKNIGCSCLASKGSKQTKEKIKRMPSWACHI
jgi:hypothetical protein